MANMNKSELMNSFLKWIDQFPDDVVFARVDIEFAFVPNRGVEEIVCPLIST